MAMQPITDAQGHIIDEYDDNEPEEAKPDHLIEPSSDITVPEAALPVRVQKEDVTDFDQSDVVIQITLQRADGHPQGRLVSVVIHNFSGQPMIQDYREAELTDKARLDTIQRAIYPVMQRFLLDLAGRKQKKLEEEAKRVSRGMVQPTPKVVVTTPATTPAPSTTLHQPTPQPPTGKENGKKKPKYQTIPMF